MILGFYQKDMLYALFNKNTAQTLLF